MWEFRICSFRIGLILDPIKTFFSRWNKKPNHKMTELLIYWIYLSTFYIHSKYLFHSFKISLLLYNFTWVLWKKWQNQNSQFLLNHPVQHFDIDISFAPTNYSKVLIICSTQYFFRENTVGMSITKLWFVSQPIDSQLTVPPVTLSSAVFILHTVHYYGRNFQILSEK